jgi:hypothetical protein
VLQPELSDGDLHTQVTIASCCVAGIVYPQHLCAAQLEYFQSLFERPSGPVSDYLAPHAAVTADLRRVAADFVTQNAYHVVDADAVFGYADSLRPP